MPNKQPPPEPTGPSEEPETRIQGPEAIVQTRWTIEVCPACGARNDAIKLVDGTWRCMACHGLFAEYRLVEVEEVKDAE